MTLMSGEIEYDNLFFPVRDEIAPKNYLTFKDKLGINVTIPNLTGADLTTFAKAQYFPITSHIIGFLAILLVSIVIFNLILGIAVSDVQVHAKLLRKPNLGVAFKSL